MLTQLRERVKDLEVLADKVFTLATQLSAGENVQPELANRGQHWYRGARELLAQHKYSGLQEFDDCYGREMPRVVNISRYLVVEPSYFTPSGRLDAFNQFQRSFRQARALVQALESELLSRELPVKTELSFEVVVSEMDAATDLLSAAQGNDILVRAAGVVARVALERHLFTVADARKLTIIKNPPHKPAATADDVAQTLQKSGVITPIQKSQLDSLFKIGNYSAHPKETVTAGDVDRLIREGKQLTALIV